MLVSSEGETKTGFVDLMIGDGKNEMENPGSVVAVKKFWVGCRDQYESNRRPGQDNSVV